MKEYTLATFDKETIKIQKQLLMVLLLLIIRQIGNSLYHLEEFYGTGNKIESNASEESKECVACYSSLASTIILPCRHLCLCSKCAQIVRMQTSKCPICRTNAESFINLKIDGITETKIDITE